jgi:hypothetical protein
MPIIMFHMSKHADAPVGGTPHAYSGGAETPPFRREQLVARIRHAGFVRALQHAGVAADQLPVTAPLCGDLLVTYVFELPDSTISATPALLEQAGIATGELATLARANLRAAVPEPQFFAQDRCALAYTGDAPEAVLLLVDSLWEEMQANFVGEIVASVPRRDRLLVCDSADSGAVERLRAQTLAFFGEPDESHALSTQLMVRRGGAWTLLD